MNLAEQLPLLVLKELPCIGAPPVYRLREPGGFDKPARAEVGVGMASQSALCQATLVGWPELGGSPQLGGGSFSIFLMPAVTP